MPISSKYIGGCPDGFVPAQYLMLHPDGAWHWFSATSPDTAAGVAREYSEEWVRGVSADELRQHKDGRHTLWRTGAVWVDESGGSCIELQAAWEMSTKAVYDAYRNDAWPLIKTCVECGL